MSKKLPSVFAGNVGSLNNTQRVYYSYNQNKNEEVISQKEEMRPVRNTNLSKIEIEEKIQNIFSSPKYIYKAQVKITTTDGVAEKKIVGRNLNELITMDNERIPIDVIKDIELL